MILIYIFNNVRTKVVLISAVLIMMMMMMIIIIIIIIIYELQSNVKPQFYYDPERFKFRFTKIDKSFIHPPTPRVALSVYSDKVNSD